MKSVQVVSKQKTDWRTPYSKTDVRYWHRAIFRTTYSGAKGPRVAKDWAAKIQRAGRRETFSLGTPNRTAAAARARDLYVLLQSSGWDAAIARFKPQSNWSGSVATTVGEFLNAVEANWSGKRKTLHDYGRAFRKIVADIFRIDGGTAKYDYRTGGREAWIAKIDRIKLREIAPEKIQRWKVDFLRRAGTDPQKRRCASISANSLMRQAKSLFAPAVLKFINLDISSSPFAGVAYEPRRSMRYQSSFDLERVIREAQDELPREEFKIFLLAVMAGLRRNEIDKLEWSAFDWEKGMISIRATQYFSPKSEDSTGDVEVDHEVMDLFRGFSTHAPGNFVVESSVQARPEAAYSHYRCQKLFKSLACWLREHGVTGNRPLHALRKEYGSQVCAKHGIFAASRALRHADIAITSQHYLDKRQSARAGLGGILTQAPNVVSINHPIDTVSPENARMRLRAR